MLEIIAVIALANKNKKNAMARGRNPGGFAALTYVLWFGLEIFGAFIGAASGAAGAYVLALLFAGIGGLISYLVAKNCTPGNDYPQQQTPYQGVPYNPSPYMPAPNPSIPPSYFASALPEPAPVEPTAEGAYYIEDIRIAGSDCVKCPKCSTVQRNNRKCCFNCGAVFIHYKGDSNTGNSFYKKDNMGTRYDTPSKAAEYFMSRMMQQTQDPGVTYQFENTENAKNALLGIPCIKIAADTKELICTQALNFGFYTDDACYAMLYGKGLTHTLWQQAKESFERCGGKPHNELEPEITAADAERRPGSRGIVEYVKEEQVNDAAGMVIYRIYKAPDAQTAKQFLSESTVTQPLYYFIVETPEGNYGRDKDGMYKENS